MLARGFGGHKISALLERVRNSKSRHFKHVTTLIGVNDCLSSDFDAKEAVSSLEKLIYLINHKFSPETISLCTVTPLGAFRKDFNLSLFRRVPCCSFVPSAPLAGTS